jgi:hypothetical protein
VSTRAVMADRIRELAPDEDEDALAELLARLGGDRDEELLLTALLGHTLGQDPHVRDLCLQYLSEEPPVPSSWSLERLLEEIEDHEPADTRDIENIEDTEWMDWLEEQGVPIVGWTEAPGMLVLLEGGTCWICPDDRGGPWTGAPASLQDILEMTAR